MTLRRLLDLGGGLVAERLEAGRVLDGEVGEHLAVYSDAREVQAVDKSAVGQSVLAHGGVDALNPERAEGALLAFAVAVAILHGLLDRLLGDADRILAPAVVALGLLQHLPVL